MITTILILAIASFVCCIATLFLSISLYSKRKYHPHERNYFISKRLHDVWLKCMNYEYDDEQKKLLIEAIHREIQTYYKKELVDNLFCVETFLKYLSSYSHMKMDFMDYMNIQ